MRPLRLTAENYVRFPSLTVDFTDGSTAVTGANGAGKSAVLRAIELALFADGSRDLAQWLGLFQERFELCLVFDHSGEQYRVRRAYGKNKATLDLERHHLHPIPNHPEWEPLTRESTRETQAELERLLGLSRRTFSASSYLAQGDAGAFTEASPADRKAILSDVLDPRGFWPDKAAKANEERKQAERALEADRVRIGEREEFLAANTGTADAEAGAHLMQRTAREAFVRAEEHLAGTQAALAANAAAVERAKAADQAWHTAGEEALRATKALHEARAQAEKLEAARVEEVELDWQAGRVTELERLVEEQRQVLVAVNASKVARQHADMEAELATREYRRFGSEVAALVDRQDELQQRHDHLRTAGIDQEFCRTCGQLLSAGALEITLGGLMDEIMALAPQITEKENSREEAGRVADDLHARAAAISIPLAPALNGYDEALREARAASEKRAALAERIRHMEGVAKGIPELEKQLETAELILATRAAESAQAASECQDDSQLGAAVVDATGRQRQARAALDEANAQVTRIEEQLARVQAAQRELEELKRVVAVEQDDLDLLRVAELAFGRNGVPTLIVENAVGALEASANGYLAMMPTADGAVLRVELHTQREQKTVETPKETLDVVVRDTDGPRPYETYSGGERARVNITLRLALAILLADRRGAESRLLAIDEIEGLDAEGQRQLVDVIREVAPRFDIVLVASHYSGIRDAFDNVIEVEKVDGVSRIAA